MELRNSQTLLLLKSKVCKTDLSILTRAEASTLASGKTIRGTAMAFLSGLMVTGTEATGPKVNKKAMESTLKQAVESTLAIPKMIRDMALALR